MGKVRKVRYFVEVEQTILPPSNAFPMGNLGFLYNGKPVNTPVLAIVESELNKVLRR